MKVSGTVLIVASLMVIALAKPLREGTSDLTARISDAEAQHGLAEKQGE